VTSKAQINTGTRPHMIIEHSWIVRNAIHRLLLESMVGSRRLCRK